MPAAGPGRNLSLVGRMAKVSSVTSSWKGVTRQVLLASPDSEYLQAEIRED